MIGLLAILQKRQLTQVAAADAIGVSKQTFTKYLKCLQRIPEDKVILLESVLEVPRKYFVSDENFCITLDVDELYELYKVIESTITESDVVSKVFKADGRKQKFSSEAKTERDLLLQNLKTMKPFRYQEPKDKEALAEMERSNAEFCNHMLRLRSESALSTEQWKSIMAAIEATIIGDRKSKQALNSDVQAYKIFTCFDKIGD